MIGDEAPLMVSPGYDDPDVFDYYHFCELYLRAMYYRFVQRLEECYLDLLD